jgi:hypothetical protein
LHAGQEQSIVPQLSRRQNATLNDITVLAVADIDLGRQACTRLGISHGDHPGQRDGNPKHYGALVKRK